MLIECSLEREEREVFSFLVMLCCHAATKIFLLGLLVPVVRCLQWSKRTNQIAQVFRKVLIAHLVKVVAPLLIRHHDEAKPLLACQG